MGQAEYLIEQFKKAKTLPHLVTRLIQLINDDESTLQDFEEVIRVDPLLVSRLLTLVNSSYFGLMRKVDSISRAVALLGMKNLHNIAVTDALKGMLAGGVSNAQFTPEVLWLHCSASAICCKMIAERIFTLNGDDAYLCGILHDIGLIAEWQAAPDTFLDLYQRIGEDDRPLTELEQELFTTDHSQIGYLLTQEWQIAEPVAIAIRDHHLTDDSITPQSPTGILQISEYIVSQLNLGIKQGIPITLSPSLTAHLQENIEEYRVVAEDLPEEVERARQLYGS